MKVYLLRDDMRVITGVYASLKSAQENAPKITGTFGKGYNRVSWVSHSRDGVNSWQLQDPSGARVDWNIREWEVLP